MKNKSIDQQQTEKKEKGRGWRQPPARRMTVKKYKTKGRERMGRGRKQNIYKSSRNCKSC